MRTGKISENVLKRSVLKRCRSKSADMAQGPAIGQDCAIVRTMGQKLIASCVKTVTFTESGQIRIAVYNGVNNLYCSHAYPVSVMLAVLLPLDAEEETLRRVMDETDQACRENAIVLSGGHTTVTESVLCPVITLSFTGLISEEDQMQKKLYPGLDIVMAGMPAMTGTALIARIKKEELEKHFPLQLIDEAAHFDEQLSLREFCMAAWEHKAVAMHDVSEGGIFGALWEFGERNQTGMEIDLKKIPIRQETIEICEYYDLNPYQMASGGSVLIAALDGQSFVDRLMEKGMKAAVIGWTTEKREKILKNGEEIRYLDKPAMDQMEEFRSRNRD